MFKAWSLEDNFGVQGFRLRGLDIEDARQPTPPQVHQMLGAVGGARTARLTHVLDFVCKNFLLGSCDCIVA